MLWDDHDMSDDWNISRSWLEEMRQKSWWHRRAIGGHHELLGLPAPRQPLAAGARRRRPLRAGPRQRPRDRRCCASSRAEIDVDRRPAPAGASAATSAAPGRSSSTRAPAGCSSEDRRAIVDDEEWDWIVEHASGDFDHLLLATTVPWLLSPGFHHLEAWSERVCDGAWGGLAARAGEKLRRAVDFDHWASFGESFARLRELLDEVGARQARQAAGLDRRPLRRRPPRLPGRDRLPAGERDPRAPIYQAVCSPYRNPLDEKERRAIRIGFSRPFIAAMRALAGPPARPTRESAGACARAPTSTTRSRRCASTAARRAMQLDKTVPGEDEERRLDCVFERRIA